MTWPCINATFNVATTLLLLAAYVFVRLGRRKAHRSVMLGAFGLSAVFLVSYVLYHLQAGATRYEGEGVMRAIYFTILVSHSVLAAAIVPMALRTGYLAWRARYLAHRAIARWTLPLWLYVSVTGVVIYGMLY